MGSHFRTDSVPGSLVVVGGAREPWLPVLENVGWDCQSCADLRKADALFTHLGPSIGIVDLSRDEFSLNGLANLVSRHRHVRWIAFIREAQLKSDTTCQFIVNFCIDFFTAPIPDAQLRNTIGHQLGMLKLEKKVWPELNSKSDLGLIGDSMQIKRLRDQVKRIGPTDVSILISGGSGTGKMLVARAVHATSSRSKGPIISVNCGAMSENRLQSELFGIELSSGKSFLEQAHMGTVILSDIMSMPLSQQLHLLRFMQEGTIECQDGVKELDVRILATNSLDIESRLTNGDFNEDLYHHLNVLSINVPSLKDRNGDIEVLAKYYLDRHSREYNSQVRSFSPEAMQALSQYHWPGNLRELDNHIKRLVLMSDCVMLDEKSLDLPKRSNGKMTLKVIRERSEKEALKQVLDTHSGQVSPAAKELGVSRATMYRLLNKHNLITSDQIM
jgi:DNA-binding NtrC family response regulator